MILLGRIGLGLYQSIQNVRTLLHSTVLKFLSTFVCGYIVSRNSTLWEDHNTIM